MIRKDLYHFRRLISTALVLALVLSIGIFASADAESKMTWAYPQPGDDMIYYWEFEKDVQEVDFIDIAMYISFDVAEGGKQHLIRAGWLPELTGEEAEGSMELDVSFYEHLNAHCSYLEHSDIFGRDPEELVKESGLSRDEAKNKWYTSIQLQTAEAYPYRIEILDNYCLHGQDIILGAYGAEALSVEDCEIDGRAAVKASIDYTGVYDDSILSKEDWERLEPSLIKNYIFIFDEAGEYLISVSGTSDMETLLKISENVEIKETKLSREYYDDGINYILCDLARG